MANLSTLIFISAPSPSRFGRDHVYKADDPNLCVPGDCTQLYGQDYYFNKGFRREENKVLSWASQIKKGFSVSSNVELYLIGGLNP